MPVFLRKQPLEIPPPTEKDWIKKDEEEDLLKDPDELRHLPQPFRMVNKLVTFLIDRAWDIIEENRRLQAPKQQNLAPTQYKPSAEFQISGRANCLVASGGYIFAGLSTGLCVFSIATGEKLCAWEAAKLEICTIQVFELGSGCHLLGTVDELGAAHLFYFLKENLLHVKTINEVEDVTKRTVCAAIEISYGADYAGFLLQGSSEVWLEIYRLRTKDWLKEAEQVQAAPAPVASPTPGSLKQERNQQKNLDVQGPSPEELDLQQFLSRVESKLVPPLLLLKVRPPKPLAGSIFKNPFEALMKSDDGSILGLGYNPMIKDCHWEHQEAIFKSTFRQYLEAESDEESKEEKSSHAMFHFHLPGRTLPSGAEAKTEPEIPVASAFSVHWSKSHHLCFYLLSRPSKEKLDSDPKPDIVWPCAAPIACSAITPCSSYLAFACEDGTITVWDVFLGCPLSVTVLPDGSVIRSIQFMPCSSPFQKKSLCPRNDPVQLLVLILDGTLHLIMPEAKGFDTKLLGGRPEVPSEMISAVTPIPTLPDAVLIFFWDGTVNLMDAATEENVCQFVMPPSYKVGSPWQPVFSVDASGQCLVLRGEDRSGGAKAEMEPLVLFDLMSCPPLESLASKAERSQDPSADLPWDRRCDVFLSDNLERLATISSQMPECWSQLRDHAAALMMGKAKEEEEPPGSR
uniref:WD repeat-containing protein 93 n=1 Tax=Pogona vitticeps TaxID=103695 RepID=A0ABM5EX97_9SAUR